LVDSGVFIFFSKLNKQSNNDIGLALKLSVIQGVVIQRVVIQGVVIHGVVRMADTSQSSQDVSRGCSDPGWCHPLTHSGKEIIFVSKTER